MIRFLINLSRKFSNVLDKLLPSKFKIDGNGNFGEDFLPRYITGQGFTLYDVGGGKQPCISLERKTTLRCRVIGIDIDQRELDQAPPNVYDRTIQADITKYVGEGDGDFVICRALLEHVKSAKDSLRNINSILKPGGLALIFVPSHNAVYSRLNLLLPGSIKRKILFFVHPETKGKQGFPAYYDRCTPKEFKRMAADLNFEIVEFKAYFISSYFNFFFPFYMIWRIWILLFWLMAGENAAETFSIVLRKK